MKTVVRKQSRLLATVLKWSVRQVFAVRVPEGQPNLAQAFMPAERRPALPEVPEGRLKRRLECTGRTTEWFVREIFAGRSPRRGAGG
jgi:hypothetical protein